MEHPKLEARHAMLYRRLRKVGKMAVRISLRGNATGIVYLASAVSLTGRS
jgi:hypothetical protein